MTYSQRLKKARAHAKINQATLATRSGVSQQTISKIERDKQEASAYTVQFATACGVRPEWLATGEGGMTETEPRAREKPAPYESLSPVALDVALAWSRLPLLMQNLYRDAIFRDAAVEKLLGGFKVGRPTSASYDAFEKSVESSYFKFQRQLKLKLES